MTNEWARARAAKRGGKHTFISLDDDTAEGRYLCESIADASPRKIFERRWALTILEQALDKLSNEWRKSGKAAQFAQLQVFLSGETAIGEYDGPADRLGMTVQAVAVAVHRLRQRYRELVRAEIAQTVTTREEAEEEMSYLFAALS